MILETAQCCNPEGCITLWVGPGPPQNRSSLANMCNATWHGAVNDAPVETTIRATDEAPYADVATFVANCTARAHVAERVRTHVTVVISS